MRKLASIQTILELKPIENADAIECAVILGWEVVVKKDEFNVGDKCVFFEIDSILPNEERYSFLGDPRKDLNGYRLKSIRLRGQLSQGLALPLSAFEFPVDFEVDTDLTETLLVRKYEPPVPEEAGAKASSSVWEISKTDEPRYQSNLKVISKMQAEEYYASVKLDGTSTTVICNIEDGEPVINVCGRNICYMEAPHNKYWAVAMRYEMKEKMLEYYITHGKRLAFQGELIGPKIQGNKMGLSENDLYIFNVFIAEGKAPFIQLDLDCALDIVKEMGMKFVPIIEREESFSYTKDDLQGLTNRKYVEFFPHANPKQNIEGLVIRDTNMMNSFKVISNKFLLEGGE